MNPLTLTQCKTLFKQKEEMIQARIIKRIEVKEKHAELHELSVNIENKIKEIDRKLPKFLAGLK